MSNSIKILDTDDWIVGYNKDTGVYQVAYFEDNHFKDECFFNERDFLVKCKDCKLKHYSESNNLWCDILKRIMPEDGYCCFGGGE